MKLFLVQAKILSNSNIAKDKLTVTKELQKSIQPKEVSNERLTQEEIDNIYKTLDLKKLRNMKRATIHVFLVY